MYKVSLGGNGMAYEPDMDVVRRQVIHQNKLAAKHLNTNNVKKIRDFIGSHVIYPGAIIDKPLADFKLVDESFILDQIKKVLSK